MNAVTLEKEESLRQQIGEAQGQLGQLEQDLATVDGELHRLMTQREQYESLAHACDSLDKLDSLGAAQLFWAQETASGEAQTRIRLARQRIEEFEQRLKTVSETRQGVVARLAEGRGVLAILEDDWFELKEQEEERRNEWVVEREVGDVRGRPPTMPWTRGGEDDRLFRKSLGSALLAALVLGLLLPLIHLPVPQPTDVIEVPERLVELIRRERPIPPPPVERPRPEPKQEQKPEQKPEEKVAEQRPAEAPKPEAAPGDVTPPAEAPRERAKASGILAFSESFAKLAASEPSARLGSDARINNNGEAAIGRPERSMITTQAPGSSGGINLAALSRGVGGGGGGGAMAGVETTRVTSAIGPGGGGGGAGHGVGGQSGVAGRTDEEIQIVFDRYKASLYRLYNRELRKTPTLQGQVVLRLTIEPDGSVSMCKLESTDMEAPELVDQVIERVRLFDFGAKDVAAVTIVYPIDFLPAA